VTLAEAITRVIDRVGLSTTTDAYKDKARSYLNQILAEVAPMVPWWWLDGTTTFATVASTRSYQPVSGNVTAWWSFVDETNNRTLDIISADSYDSYDPDRSETGNPRAIYIAGTDATTGYPVVDVFPLADAAYTIRVRYRKDIDEWTSSNDSTDFVTLGIPRIIESVLIHGAVALYLEEEGDDSGAARESGNFERTLRIALRQNLSMRGNMRATPVNPERTNALIQVDSTLAVP